MSKFVKVMYGTTSGAKSDFEYKLGEVNISNNWNPKADSGKEFGGNWNCPELFKLVFDENDNLISIINIRNQII